jgi:hypothetical protein
MIVNLKKQNSDKIKSEKYFTDYRSLHVLLFLIAGIFLGLSHYWPYLWLTAWIGIAITVVALHLAKNKLWGIAGIFIGGFAAQWVGHPWYMPAVNRFGGGTWSLSKTIIAWLFINLSMVFPERFPLMATFTIKLLAKSTGISLNKDFTVNSIIKNISAFLSENIWVWLPAIILLGEWCNLHLSGMAQASWLYSQWQVNPILRCTAYFGWSLATVFCLTIASLIGEGLFFRCKKRLFIAGTGILYLLLLPALPDDIPPVLKKIGAVHMSAYVNRPTSAPPGIKLLIWPEVARTGRPRISEGMEQNLLLTPPFYSPGTYHIIGQETRIAEGFQNSVLALGPEGKLLAARAKKFLFPGAERSFMGLHLPTRIIFVPGKSPPYIDVDNFRVAALLCFEELDHSLALEGAKAGSDLLTVSAIEYSMGDSIEVQNQFIGIGVFLAVETGLPVVRSSIVGPAAIIAPDGRVLAYTDSGTSGILTLP